MLQLFCIVGVVSIMVSGFFVGAWTNGQQQRANFHSETLEHRNFRTKMALLFGMTGIVSLGIAGLIFFL